MEGQTDGWKNGQTDGWKNGQTDGWKNGQTDGWTEERTDGWMNIWKFTPVPYRTSALWGRCPKKRWKENKREQFPVMTFTYKDR